MAKCVVVVPEGCITRDSREIGKPYEVSNIKDLGGIIGYSDSRSGVVAYLSSYYGVVSSESIIDQKRFEFESMGRENFHKWVLVVSEEIVRLCILNCTCQVYLMCRKYRWYRSLVDELKCRGVEIYTPIMGKSDKIIKSILG